MESPVQCACDTPVHLRLCAPCPGARLLAQCTKEGLRKLADDLQIHKQRLDDLVAEARNGKDG